METISVRETIKAPAAKVYKTMLAPDTYGEWTSVFNPTSRYQGSWEKGSIMYFLGDAEGRTMGMISKVRENIPNQFISLEHIGYIDNEKEFTDGKEVEGIKDTLEEYRFIERDGSTEVEIRMDTHPDYKESMLKIWPRALERLKNLCE